MASGLARFAAATTGDRRDNKIVANFGTLWYHSYHERHLYRSGMHEATASKDRRPSLVRTALSAMAPVRSARRAIPLATAETLHRGGMRQASLRAWLVRDARRENAEARRSCDRQDTSTRHVAHAQQTGIHSALQERASQRQCRWLCVGASVCHGSGSWAPTPARRVGASQERHTRRQPAGKSRSLGREASIRPASRGLGSLGTRNPSSVWSSRGGRR